VAAKIVGGVDGKDAADFGIVTHAIEVGVGGEDKCSEDEECGNADNLIPGFGRFAVG
jgi:hypothetical protein